MVNENVAQGLPANAQVQAGLTDADDGTVIEKGIGFPWMIDPEVTWLDYRCWIEVSLDAGMVLHKPLPQSQGTIDTIASFPNVMSDAHADAVSGVNTVSNNDYADIPQRMATSTYRFVLKGYGLRAGYQIPVPALQSVAGVTPIPDAFQWSSGNVIVGNLGGIPVYRCSWELHYFVTAPPKSQQLPPPNVADGIRADDELPDKMQVPYSPQDMQSVPAIVAPPKPPGFFVGGGGGQQ